MPRLRKYLSTVACAAALLALNNQAGWAQSEPAAQPPDTPHDMTSAAGLGALQIRGFNDIDYRAFQAGSTPNTFTLGQLDLFLSSRLSPEFNVIGELVVEAEEDNTIGVDLERMLVQYSPNDLFTISAGRYHTAIGFYNASYHHGNWFQTAIGRPFIFRFEDDGGILPVHGVGITVQGQIPSGSLGLRYVAEVSNGRRTSSPDEEAVQSVADENDNKAVNVALMSRPASLPGLQVGFSAYRDRRTPRRHEVVDETIIAAHIVYESPSFEQLNEVIVISHTPARSARSTTTSFYTQVAPRFGRYHPYFRFEYLDVPKDAFGPVIADIAGRSYGPSVGVRFDAATAVALKLQYDRFTGPIRNETTGLTAQIAFTF